MSVKRLLTYEVGAYVLTWLLWFPITSVGPAERPSIEQELPKNPYAVQIKELDGLIEKVRTGHLPDSNKERFKQLLTTETTLK